MTRNKKKTEDYLNQLQSSGYAKTQKLFGLYHRWKEKLDIESLSKFLDVLWDEKENIRPSKLGIATYNNFRGVAFEEFVHDAIDKALDLEKTKFELFWNDKILREEFYILEGGSFKKHPKYKAVDLTIGMREDKLIHPIAVISCKNWYDSVWLDDDRTVFDNIRNKYPHVFGYGVCMDCNVPAVSLISAQRTGLKVYPFKEKNCFDEFIGELRNNLQIVENMT